MSTVIIHGTMARDETWWRSDRPGGFVDCLVQGMVHGEMTPDVWTIGGRDVSAYEILRQEDKRSLWGGHHAPFEQIAGRFRWSGLNSHDLRLHAGQQLARYLETLASICPEEPIHVVAHSHGANVVKIATNQLSAPVRLGRLVFLAAPHCTRVAGGRGTYLYPLNPDRLSFNAGQAPCVLNIFSEEDTVQTGWSDAGPLGDPLAGAVGTSLSPVFDAARVDSDPRVQFAYENLRVQTRMGKGIRVHGAMHGPKIGLVVGCWLACWPNLSGAQCLKHFGIEFLTDTDPG